jgi:hypothetical protein
LRALSRAKKEVGMRGPRKKGDGRWHEAVERSVHFTEHKIQRPASGPMIGLMHVDEAVDSATTK